MRSFKERSRAFSLVELLVVLAVIAVIIAMLLPALLKARQAAWTVQCASNLRQIGVLLVMYSNQSGGAYPLAASYKTRNADGSVMTTAQNLARRWRNELTNAGIIPNTDYICMTDLATTYNQKSWAKLYCPAYYEALGGTSQGSSYANALPSKYLPANRGIGGYTTDDSSKPDVWTKVHEVQNAPTVVALFETASDWQTVIGSGSRGSLRFRHNNGANYLCADSHVEWQPRSFMVTAAQFDNAMKIRK